MEKWKSVPKNKSKHGEGQRRDDQIGRTSEEGKNRRAKRRKITKHRVLSMIDGLGGSKHRLATAAGAETFGQTRNEKWHAVVVRSLCESQTVQSTRHSQTAF